MKYPYQEWNTNRIPGATPLPYAIDALVTQLSDKSGADHMI